MADPKITMVGAGGMSFGPTMVNDVIHTSSLAGARLMLHDVDEARLLRAYRMASRLNAANSSPIRLDYSVDPAEALDGADFCIASAEFKRFEYWKQDYEIPRRHGSTQINGENGGPGAVFHSLRSIKNTLSICADIEKYCPDAFFVNLSNPMSRVTLAVNRATNLANVGMCHEMPIGITRLGLLLRVPARKIRAKASGINHFTFFTEMTHTETGEDLLERVRALYERPFFDFSPRTVAVAKALLKVPWFDGLSEQMYQPIVTHMVRTYGLVPASTDSHIGEYLPFAHDVADWHPHPYDFHRRFNDRATRLAERYADGASRIPFHRFGHSLEEVIPIIAAIWTGQPRRVNAVNVPNQGWIPNVAEGAIVEVGAIVDGDGIHPEEMPPVADPIAGCIATQVGLQDLIIRSALTGDPELAFEALLNDPHSPADRQACRAMFDELRALQGEHLPF